MRSNTLNIPQVRVGSTLRVFKPLHPRTWNEVIKYYAPKSTDIIGEGREELARYIFSLFDVEVIPTAKGSKLDIEGVDILLRIDNRKDILVQVKSSIYGALKYLEDRPVRSEEVILLWVDATKASSRRRLYKLLLPVLSNLGIELKSEVRKAIEVKEALKNNGHKHLPMVKNKPMGMSTQDVDALLRLGLLELQGGLYVLK